MYQEICRSGCFRYNEGKSVCAAPMPDPVQVPDPSVQPPNEPVSALVERIQSGDSSAEKQLYERYSERVYYLALVRTRSKHDAEDVRSETFLRVLRAVRNQQLRQPGSLSSFLLRTLDNVVLEMHRKEQRAQQPIVEESTVMDEHFVDEGVKTAIGRALDRLKPRERDCLRMWYYDELPKEEIARRTGIADERVRLLKSRALKSFREIYLRLRKSDTNPVRRSLL